MKLAAIVAAALLSPALASSAPDVLDAAIAPALVGTGTAVVVAGSVRQVLTVDVSSPEYPSRTLTTIDLETVCGPACRHVVHAECFGALAATCETLRRGDRVLVVGAFTSAQAGALPARTRITLTQFVSIASVQ